MILEQDEILKLIPHVFPFVMLDRVLEIIPRQRGMGLKAITYNEFFLDREDDCIWFKPVFIIEACGQLTAVVCSYEVKGPPKLNYLAAIPSFRFSKPVLVGDRLYVESVIVKQVQQLLHAEVRARVGDKVVAEGSMVVTSY